MYWLTVDHVLVDSNQDRWADGLCRLLMAKVQFLPAFNICTRIAVFHCNDNGLVVKAYFIRYLARAQKENHQEGYNLNLLFHWFTSVSER